MKLFITESDESPPSISERTIALSVVLALTLLSTFTFHTHVAESFTWLLSIAQTTEGEINESDIHVRQEVLWLARAIYSETKRPQEQRLIAWVIRARVESTYYPNTYKEVVLQRNQFSGLNPYDKNYGINITRGYQDSGIGWDTALLIAESVYDAPDLARLVASNVLHFYSPHAVKSTPKWAVGEPEQVVRDPNKGYVRFAFHADVMGN